MIAGYNFSPGTTSATVSPAGYAVSSFGPLGTADDGPTLQAAMTNAIANPGRYYLPPGAFTIATRPTLLASNFALVGAGKGATILNWHTNLALQIQGQQLNGDGSTIQNITNVELEDFSLLGTGVGGGFNNQFLLFCKWFGAVNKPGISLRRMAIGNDTNRTINMGLPNNIIEQWGFYCEEVDFIGHTTVNAFEAIILADVERVRFKDCLWENYQYAGISVYTQVDDLKIIHCTFDAGIPSFVTSGGQTQSAQGIILKKSLRNLVIRDSRFRGIWGSPAIADGSGAGGADNYGFVDGYGFTIKDSNFYDCQAGIDLTGCTNAEIMGNTFDKLQTQGIRLGSSGSACSAEILGNFFKNCGQARPGASGQAGIYIQPTAAQRQSNRIVIEGNKFEDNQSTPSMTSGVALDIKPSRIAYNVRIKGNKFPGVASPINVISGVFDPVSCLIEENSDYNPLHVQTGPVLTTAVALLPTFNAHSRAIITGGTVTQIKTDVTAPPTNAASVNSRGAVAGVDLTNGLGAGWTVTPTNSITPTYRRGSNETEGGTASPNFAIANATDQVLVSAIPNPTVAPTLSAAGNHSPYPIGTYTVGYTWYNDNGESALSPTANVTITNGNPQIKIDLSALTIPAGVLGARAYITASTASPAVLGLVGDMPISATGTPTIAANSINQLPFGSPPPTVAPVISDGGAPANPSVFGGSTTIGISYVTTNNWESAIGPASGAVTITAGDLINVAQLNLDSFIIITNGQIGVSKIRYYMLTGTGGPGLLAEQAIQLPATPGGPAFVPAITIAGVLSPVAAPTYDVSKSPDHQPTPIPAGTAGWKVPTGVTTMRFYINQNGTVTFVTQTPSASGIVAPFILSGPGTAGAVPTTNNTGTSVATAAPAVPLVLPVPAGDAISCTFTVAPTVVWVVE